MEPLFLTCAILGGTVMVAQFILSLLGMGDHADSVDHDFTTEVADTAHELGHTAGEHGAGGDHGSTQHAPQAGAQQQVHSSTWFFGVITFRTVVAALAFFGLTGMAATTAQLEQPMPLVIALASGTAALYGVHLMMQALYRLRSDGTQRISRALGCEATVYLSIPGRSQGAGKVHLTMQNRLLEYEAITAGERVPIGTRVVVTGIAGPGLLEVEPTPEMARNA